MKNRAAHERVRALRSASRRRSRHGRSGEAATEDPSTVPLGSGARQDFGHGIGRLHISADVLKLNDVTQLHVTYEMCLDVHMFMNSRSGSRPYPDVSCDYIKRSDFSRDNRQPCSSDKHSSCDNRTWQHCWYNSNVVLQCADVCVRQNRLISTFVLSSASSGGRCVHSIGVRKIKKSRSATMNANQKGEKNLGGSILI